MTDIVRLSVDKATKDVLDQLSDHLDDEPRWAAEMLTELRTSIIAQSETVELAIKSVGSGTAENLAELQSALADVTTMLDRQQTQIDNISATLQRMSRPWWKKII